MPESRAKSGEFEVLAPARLTGRAKLQTVTDISNELARVYRATKGGSLDINVATKLTYILSTLAKVKVDAELEARLEALEQGASR